MDLDKKDRLILANQFKILEKLYPNEAEDYQVQRKAIENGYSLQYDMIAEHLSPEMSRKDCQEVLEILSMYRAITHSATALTRNNSQLSIDTDDLKFRGFDGNNEFKQFSYCQYFIIDLDRFRELRYGNQYPDLNSHSPTLNKYRRMVEVWNQNGKRHELTEKQIKALIEA